MLRILPGMAINDRSDMTPSAASAWIPFALGFRAFFLLAGLSAILLMAVWLLIRHALSGLPAHYDPIAWHAHEMLFGYTAAVIAGFLLTAVRNWTGVDTWTGPRLALLALVWLLGRLLPWVPGVPVAVLIAVDAAFLPLVGLSLMRPLWQGQNRINRVFLPLLLAMGLANLLSHLQMLDLLGGLGDMRRVMLELILALIALVGGRVMPFFTRSVLPGFKFTQRLWVERLTLVSLTLIILGESAAILPGSLMPMLWLVFGASQAIRLAGWFDRRIFAIPVLWVLHVGYAWLVLGALLTALAGFSLFPSTSALHALTVGGVGVFTMGMMARVARGHTGRPIDVTRTITLAFLAMNLAALIRVFATAWIGSAYGVWVDLSGVLWVFGFTLFAWQYAPILLYPRVDGRPG